MNKKNIITALLVLFAIIGLAQDVNTCKPIAERILTAAQNHTPDGIDELLAPDFHYNKIKQPTAAKVLKQIMVQMPAMTTAAQTNLLASDSSQLHPSSVKGIKKDHLIGKRQDLILLN